MREIDFREDLLPLKNRLYRLALRITLDAAEAEDIVEETLLRVWRRRDELSAVSSLEAYCLTVCRNLAVDAGRRPATANVPLDEAGDEAIDTGHTPEEGMAHDERMRLVGQLFDRLPEMQRTVMQLRDIEGLSYQEVAKVTGLTEANVKVTLFRARQRIKKEYERIENYGL